MSERSEIKCKCEDCGKTWCKGEEGDNERFCLKCQYSQMLSDMDPEEYSNYLIYGDGT